MGEGVDNTLDLESFDSGLVIVLALEVEEREVTLWKDDLSELSPEEGVLVLRFANSTLRCTCEGVKDL